MKRSASDRFEGNHRIASATGYAHEIGGEIPRRQAQEFLYFSI
jgi:hypothetical protein